MKQYQLHILIANLWIIASFVVKDFYTTMVMVMFGFFWLILGIISMLTDYSLDGLKSKLERMKFKIIMDLLMRIAKVKPRRKKK